MNRILIPYNTYDKSKVPKKAYKFVFSSSFYGFFFVKNLFFVNKKQSTNFAMLFYCIVGKTIKKAFRKCIVVHKKN